MCTSCAIKSLFNQISPSEKQKKKKRFVISSVTILFTLNVKEVITRDSIKQGTENLWSSSWLKHKQTAVLSIVTATQVCFQTAIESSIYKSL